MSEELSPKQRARKIISKKLKEAGGAPLWRINADCGCLEAWLVCGQIRILHLLPGDNGVEMYQPIPAANFEEMLAKAVPDHASRAAQVPG
jgi:hypothetical protein